MVAPEAMRVGFALLDPRSEDRAALGAASMLEPPIERQIVRSIRYHESDRRAG